MPRGSLGPQIYDLNQFVDPRSVPRSKLINDFINIFNAELKDVKKIKISSFGTFEIINKNQRIGRNPKTKETANISARRVVKFKSSAHFKNKLNNL